jgi:hypothetical protein
LDNARRIVPRPDVVIISGDFLAHGFQSTFVSLSGNKDPAALASFIDKTMAFITRMVNERFPKTAIFPALGNNDSYCGDYKIDPAGKFLATTSQTWKSLIKDRSNVASFMKTFPVNGSYVVSMPGSTRHRIIVLNTIFFSRNYENSCGNSQDNPARDELAWVEAALQKAAAANEKVWLLYHILPGIDVFATVDSHSFEAPVLNFTQSYNDQFLDLLNRYSYMITNSFVGHTHMDSFQLIAPGVAKKATSTITITPAISPIFDNNPGFKVFTYNRQSLALVNYSTYFLDLGANTKNSLPAHWNKEFEYRTTYNRLSLDPVSLQSVYLLMPIDYQQSLTHFSKFYNVSNTASPAITDTNWPAYWCGIGFLTAARYAACYRILTDQQSSDRMTLGIRLMPTE